MANIDIEYDDFLYGCTSHEKQRIIDSLYDDGYLPSDLNSDELEMNADSSTEIELVKTLQNIWKNRLFLNNNDLESLNHYANKGAYEN
jgi:hypothetical protein